MRIRWRGLELPTKLELDKTVSTDKYGVLHVEPFERGFGTTIGNSLRRILLSSIEGCAVSAIKIKGADHEFTSIPGVLEDMTDIVLNVKSLIVNLDSDEPEVVTLKKNTAGLVTAADIVCTPNVTVIDPKQPIATLTEDVDFEMELTVSKGRGYVTAKEAESMEPEVGVIPVDAIYSPVTRVRYKVVETRVGQSLNYDKLVIEIWTDGTVSPEMSLVEAAKIMRKHLGAFIQYFEMGEKLAEQTEEIEVDEETSKEDEELRAKLDMPITELELSVRAANCLEMAKFETVGQMIKLTESQLLALRSFGKTSLREVKRKIEDLGLTLGYDN